MLLISISTLVSPPTSSWATNQYPVRLGTLLEGAMYQLAMNGYSRNTGLCKSIGLIHPRAARDFQQPPQMPVLNINCLTQMIC